MTSTEQMQVDMEHRLPCPGITVHYGTIARISDVFLARDIPGRDVQFADNVRIGLNQIIDRRYVPPWND